MTTNKFTHLDASGNPKMVDVGEKNITQRLAVAQSMVVLPDAVLELLKSDEIHSKKGPVFQTAIIASTMAAKKTGDLIPLCHPLQLTHVDIQLKTDEKKQSVYCLVEVKTSGQTGV